MPDPVLLQPTTATLSPGCYYWCTCGKTDNPPYCDGAHWGSGFFPKPFEIPESGAEAPCLTVKLCNCKHTQSPPYCDGTHKSLVN